MACSHNALVEGLVVTGDVTVVEIDRRKFGAVKRSAAHTATPAAALSRTTRMVLAFRLRINQISRRGVDDLAARNFQRKFGAFSDRAEKVLCGSRPRYTCFDSEQVCVSKRKGTEIISTGLLWGFGSRQSL